MATMKTTAKRNPITGYPAPAYTKGKQSNFAGTDRKREPEYMQVNTRDRMNAEKQANKDLNKSLNAGIPTKGQMRREERGRTQGGSTTTSSTTNSRGRGSSGGDFKNTHVKKSQVKSVNQGIKGRGKKGASKSCKKLFK